MAERRMFAKTIIDSDAFLDMPVTARLLYYDLAMRADDDGFVNSPKKIMRMVGASDDDAKILAMKKFIIPFDNGVVVIKHWRIHNYIRKDTYNETPYKEQKAQLELDENSAYRLIDPSRQRLVDGSSTQDRIGKVSIDKDSIDKDIEPLLDGKTFAQDILNSQDFQKASKPIKHKYGEYGHVLLTDDELSKLKEWFPGDYERLINNLDNGIELKGYKYKNHYLAILKWAEKDAPAKKQEPKAAAPTSADMAHMADVLARIKGGG